METRRYILPSVIRRGKQADPKTNLSNTTWLELKKPASDAYPVMAQIT